MREVLLNDRPIRCEREGFKKAGVPLTLGTPIFRPSRGNDMLVEDQLFVRAAASRTSAEILVGSLESY